MKKRSEFLAAAAKGKKWVAPGVIVQLLEQPEHSDIRLGLTASRKVGGAVVRNRARRRLRALAREILPQSGLNPCDLVLIAKHTTPKRSFADLRADLLWALKRLRTAATTAPTP